MKFLGTGRIVGPPFPRNPGRLENVRQVFVDSSYQSMNIDYAELEWVWSTAIFRAKANAWFNGMHLEIWL